MPHLRRVAEEIGLTVPQLIVGEHVMADAIPVLPSLIENVGEAPVAAETAPAAASDFPRPLAAHIAPPHASFEKPVETPGRAAERQKLINELVGHEEPARRRPWRRGSP